MARWAWPPCRISTAIARTLPAAPDAGPIFTDVTEAAGLSRALNVSGSPELKQFILEEMGCGVALFDYDNDGWLDILLVNGSSFDPAVRDTKPRSYLFHNNGDGTFTDVTDKAGLTRSRLGAGVLRGRLRQRWVRRRVRDLLGAARPVSQQRERHVH